MGQFVVAADNRDYSNERGDRHGQAWATIGMAERDSKSAAATSTTKLQHSQECMGEHAEARVDQAVIAVKKQGVAR